MNAPEQDNNLDKQQVSLVAKDMTFGERTYDFVFNQLINFWVNLVASAAFTYWVSHSQSGFKLLGKEFSAPSVIQQKIAKGLHDAPPLGAFGEKAAYDIHNPPTSNRAKAANTLSNVLTLVTAGHFIMIPSVWLGAKIKAPLVEWLNRGHYGADAMEDPSLKLRHAAIRLEERPTLLGAFVGRIGTIIATQLTGYSIGNASNVVRTLGKHLKSPILQSFPGVDGLAEVAGNKLGQTVEELMPHNTTKLDTRLREPAAGGTRYDWSKNQIQHNPSLKDTPYQRASQHMGKYLAQDVLYTFVTAATIAPAINFAKKFVPGMTYKPTDAAAAKVLAEHETPKKFHVRPNPIMARAPITPPEAHDEAPARHDTPRPQVSNIDISSTARLAVPAQEVQVS